MAGQPTADGEQALCLARTLIAHGPIPERLAEAYAAWFDTAFDIGSTTRAALGPASQALRRGDNALVAAKTHGNVASQANGSLMRAAPLGIYGHALPVETLIEFARADAAITHPNDICQDATAIYVVGIAAAMRGLPADEVLTAMLDHGAICRLNPKVRSAVVCGRQGQPFAWDRSQAGWVLGALYNACYRLQEGDSVQGLVDTVRMGGDTDTNAAIAGALLGAVHGRDAWPAPWRQAIRTFVPVAGTPTRHPRPVHLWPVDAEILAERLLVAGSAWQQNSEAH